MTTANADMNYIDLAGYPYLVQDPPIELFVEQAWATCELQEYLALFRLPLVGMTADRNADGNVRAPWNTMRHVGHNGRLIACGEGGGTNGSEVAHGTPLTWNPVLTAKQLKDNDKKLNKGKGKEATAAKGAWGPFATWFYGIFGIKQRVPPPPATGQFTALAQRPPRAFAERGTGRPGVRHQNSRGQLVNAWKDANAQTANEQAANAQIPNAQAANAQHTNAQHTNAQHTNAQAALRAQTVRAQGPWAQAARHQLARHQQGGQQATIPPRTVAPRTTWPAGARQGHGQGRGQGARTSWEAQVHEAANQAPPRS